jgi:hypothetical protein
VIARLFIDNPGNWVGAGSESGAGDDSSWNTLLIVIAYIPVGASLLAMAAYQLRLMLLIQRIREQARSHKK